MSFFWKKRPLAEKRGRRLKKKAVAWKKRPSPEKKGRRLKKMSATAFLLEKLLPSAIFEAVYLKYTVVWRKSILPGITINTIVHNTLLFFILKSIPCVFIQGQTDCKTAIQDWKAVTSCHHKTHRRNLALLSATRTHQSLYILRSNAL
jgi:hypothetical protein